MGSSFASDLKRGRLPELEAMIRRGRDALKSAIAELYELANDEDQYDNATDTGTAIGTLSNACQLIDCVLPRQDEIGGSVGRIQRDGSGDIWLHFEGGLINLSAQPHGPIVRRNLEKAAAKGASDANE